MLCYAVYSSRCLSNSFDDLLLLLSSGNNDNTGLPGERREFPRLIVLKHAIRENIRYCI